MLFRKATSTETEAPAETGAEEIVTTTAGPSVSEAGGILTIDCRAIVENWRALSSHAAPAECGAVVKADAYGCGIEPVAKALSRAGCRTFFVAHIFEAKKLRAVLPDAVIFVTNGIPPGAAPEFATANAQPVIGNVAELAEWDAFRSVNRWPGGAALHFDTGLNRLGLPIEEAPALAARIKLPGHGISLVMSHFACSDEPGHAMNDLQIFALREIRGMFRGVSASLANSSGIYLGAQAHFDLVRPGIALFGGNPTPGAVNRMKPVVELKARIVQVRDIDRGASVGYNATWTAKRATKIAIVSVGYADGYPRPAGASDAVTSAAEGLFGGKRCTVVGRVSMDLLAVDVTDAAGLHPRRGEYITLIGGPIEIDQFALWSRTISYDVLARFGQRYHRVWKS
ncbi:MAG TPA: alanine racemase [Xanthobacteraceae bacterium]|nr:alanine racemase [Xanthobacteraceae bacterium]